MPCAQDGCEAPDSLLYGGCSCPDGPHCFTHCSAEDATRKRAAARAKGGKRSHESGQAKVRRERETLEIPDPPTDAQEAVAYGRWVMAATSRGLIPDSTGRTLLQALKEFRLLLDASREETELQDRIDRLERLLRDRDR